MALQLDFDENMKYSLFCLKCNGSHPYYNFTRLWYLNCFLQQGAFTCVIILVLFSLAKINIAENISEACALGSFVVMYCVCSFNYFVLVKYKSSFRYLINAIKKDYLIASSLPEEEQAIVLEHATKGRFVTKFWVILTSIGTALFLLQPIAKMLYYTVTDEFRYIPVLEVVYPAFLKDVNETVLFCIVFAFFIFFAYYLSSLYLGMTPMGLAFLLHASGQLELLKVRMLKLFPKDGSITPEERTQKLREIAIHLQAIYDFVDHLNISFKILYELTLKGTSFITPILAHAMIAAYSRGEIKTELMTLFFGGFALSSQPCYYGDMLMEKSLDLRDAVYMSGWEGLYEKSTRSTILILMTRMQRSVAIRSIFVTVCLDALTDAYSRGEIKTELMTLFFGGFALSSQPCYYGDMLMEKSLDLRDAVYMSGWEGLYEKSTRSTILILMTRMQRSVAIRSIFVTVCLDALTDVARQAYALFNLIHAAL